MKRIFFNHFTSFTNWILLVGGLTAAIGLRFVDSIPAERLYWYRVTAYLIIIFFFLRIIIQNLFLKNFVGWTQQIIQIKLNSKKGIVIPFNQIKSFELKQEVLYLKTREKQLSFDLKSYRHKHVEKLLRILTKYTK